MSARTNIQFVAPPPDSGPTPAGGAAIRFALLPGGMTHGLLWNNGVPAPAVFITPREAKFMATFGRVREVMRK
jgi:hypothetical protein